MADKSDGDEKKDDDAKGGSKKKLIIIAAPVLLVVIGAAAYFLLLKPAAAPAAGAAGATPAAAAAAAPSPSPSFAEGAVLKLDPISINLAGGHFLKLGLSLQESKTAGEEVSGAKALDAAIELFSNKTLDELADLKMRNKYKTKLADHLVELYEQKVYDVYFTEFVMQ
jgi:flagellar protein FliL